MKQKKSALCSALLLNLAVGGAYAQSPYTTAAEQAVYVRNIVSFVRWPDQARTGSGEFQFCVDGDALLGFALARELKGISIRDQKAVVRLVNKKNDLGNCQAVIFANLNEKRVQNALQELGGRNVLTVGETQGFLKAGGILQLGRGQSGWQFEVNLDAARKAQLKFDARLLQMAKSVTKDGGSLTD